MHNVCKSSNVFEIYLEVQAVQILTCGILEMDITTDAVFKKSNSLVWSGERFFMFSPLGNDGALAGEKF
jgi:hypothetical protein